MSDFATSKGYQQIVMTEATRRLLEMELNADLPYRENIRDVHPSAAIEVHDCRVRLVSSGHMLGAAQVEVEYEDGLRVGYSGDFAWPLEEVIQVDELVVDSTYGSPVSVRNYSQGEAEEALVQLVTTLLRYGPVSVKAHRGTIQRGLQALCVDVKIPIVASSRLSSEVAIYRDMGYAIDELVDVESDDGRAAIQSRRYIRFFGKGDQMPVDPDGSSVTLSAFMLGTRDSPLMELSERSFKVGMSNHADFNGTLEYVRATGAQTVVTDNVRGPHGVELAEALRSRLSIRAIASEPRHAHEWGL